jgi:two-component system sensor histidine kinase BaeS
VPITVYGQDGAVVLGRPLPAGAPYVERPIILRGRIIGSARMPRVKPAPDAVEARFLRQQYAGIAGIAAVLVLLATLTAWRVSGRWVRPLLAVQQATARIARGELDVRLADAGADEIGDVVRNINRMTEGLQRLESARRRWIAEISHELRTPLAVLRGEIEALIDGVRTMQAGSMVSLREEVLRLSALIEDLHLLAMSDLRTLPCHAVEADAVDIARQVVGRFERRAARQGLALTLELGGAASAPVRWDPQRIEQVLGNLIENSLRYTDAPGRVVLTLRAQRQRVTIDVEDTAPGVPPADLERLFEPLYRADSARDRAIGGSGLGLAICNAIVRAHGGAIEAVGSALGGVHIHIDLPATAAVNA